MASVTRTSALQRLRASDDEGFTLVEMLVSIVIIGIVFSAMAAALIGALLAGRKAETRTKAIQLAARQVESQQSIKWSLLGHYADDPGWPSSGFYGGESMVSIGATTPNPRPADVPLIGPTAFTDGGITFSVTTHVTWVGSSTSDPNDGTTYAAKRLTVSMSWDESGVTRTVSTTGIRTPSAAEMKPPSDATGGGIAINNATAAPAQTLSSTGMLVSPVAIVVDTTTVASEVVATYTLSDGTAVPVALTPDATFTHWSATLPAGTGPFSAGTLTIPISAYDSYGNEAAGAAAVKFTSPVAVSFTLSNPTATISDPVLTASYLTNAALVARVSTSSQASGVTVSYTLSNGTTSAPVAMSFDGASGFWTYTYPAGTGPVTPGNVTFTFTGTSVSGGAPVTASAVTVLQAPSLGAISIPNVSTGASILASPKPICVKSSTSVAFNPPGAHIAVEVKNISAADEVRVTISNGATSYGSTNAVYKATGGTPLAGGYVYVATWSNPVLPPGTWTAAVSVARSADGATASKSWAFTVTGRSNYNAVQCAS